MHVRTHEEAITIVEQRYTIRLVSSARLIETKPPIHLTPPLDRFSD